MHLPSSIDLHHFVVLGPGRSRPRLALACVLFTAAIFMSGACTPRPTAYSVEDTETSGRITVAAAPDVRELVANEIAGFHSTYPQATFDLREPESSGQVIGALLAGRADVAAAGRELEDEERRMARAGGIEIEGHRIAQDAVCFVVSAENPVENVSVGELQRIWLGEKRDWAELGGRGGRIVPVLPPLSGDLARAFVQRVMDGQPMRAPSMVESSDSAVAARVALIPTAIGVVPLALAGQPGLKLLSVAPLDGLAYVDPDMESVHDGRYPLTRYINLYLRTRPARLAGGFVTFVASQPGQQLVLDSGRVPTAVPLRFVRRSPLRASH